MVNGVGGEVVEDESGENVAWRRGVTVVAGHVAV